MVMSRPRMGWC